MTNSNTCELGLQSPSIGVLTSPTASFSKYSNVVTHDQSWRSRVLYCRKCDGHGKQVALKGHAPKCPYSLCECVSCSKLMTKRLHSFKKRNKSRLEAAAILTAQKEAQMIASGFRRLPTNLSSHLHVGATVADITIVSQASTSNSSADDLHQNYMTSRESQKFGLGSGSKPVTVMSYEIWKEQCAARKNAGLQTRTHPEHTHQQPRKRSFDEFKRKELPSLKRISRSPPVLSRPQSLMDNDSSFIASKPESVNRFASDEYRRVTLPTIPPVTILVRRDGSTVADSIAPLPLTTNQESAFFIRTQNQASSESSSTPKPSVSAATVSLIRTPIAVNHVPSCDVKLSSASVDEVPGSAASSIVPSSPPAFSGVIHRPSPSIPSNHSLLKLPLSLASSHPVVTAQASLASSIASQDESLSTLSLRIPQPPVEHDGISEAQALALLFPSTVSQHSNAVLLAQQQQRQQTLQQIQLLPSSAIIGTSPLQRVCELVAPIATHNCLVPSLAVSGAPPIAAIDEQNVSLLRQLHRQQQLQQQLGNTNSLTSNDLLNVYQLLSDPLTSQALQAQIKQLEHSGSLFTQSIAT